jgi:hypothetical protein
VFIAGGGVLRWEHMPPMFTFRDPDGNPFRVVERRRNTDHRSMSDG